MSPNPLLASMVTADIITPEMINAVILSHLCRSRINNAPEIASTMNVRPVQGAKLYIKSILRPGKLDFWPAAINQPTKADAGSNIKAL